MSYADSERRYALVDVNNFYASCEAVFNPRLAGKPVIVTSNNDGCVVARSAHAKALGIKMAAPVHLIRDVIDAHGVIVMSSNYALYADMSNRVMTILGEMAPRYEGYSIDELFADLTGVHPLRPHAIEMRRRVLQWTGLTVCVGIGRSKVRSKLSNFIAKKNPQFDGVFDLEDLSPAEQDAWMARIPVEEVWGIGARLTSQLQALGIDTVLQLRDAEPKAMRQRFSVVVERIVEELRGESCLPLELIAPPRKQIVSSRSFGRPVTTFEELREAALSYVSRAAEKLRQQGSLAGALSVFIGTNPFKPDVPQYSRSHTLRLPFATDDTITLARFSSAALQRIYRSGYAYKRAGVMLADLSPKAQRQITLFEDPEKIARRDRLNQVMDVANKRYGSGRVALAGAGIEKRWRMNRAHLSPRFTTCIDELPVAS